jgi:crotonobetainyl-CoA:carnitine CoA-transferase CaiB-like acyl-CoA transferase
MGALDDVAVLEAGQLVQAPQATALMCEWGAQVIKVELPEMGDQARWIPVEAGNKTSAYFTACNRGKRSITLDLRTDAGREVFLRLCERVDVVVTNFVPGTLEQWGLGYADVAARNPRIIYATGSTFGTLGPDATREGADLAAQAAGGLISTIGADGDAPSPVGVTIADHCAAQNLLAGILAALLARERTGVGQQVETSLLGGQVWAQASELTAHLLTGRPAGRANRGGAHVPGLYGIFSTADGWIAIAGVVSTARPRFFQLIGRPELDERFPQRLYWDAEKAELFPLIDEAMSARTTAEWCTALNEAGVRHAPVRNHTDVLADPSVKANGYVTEVDGPDGPISVIGGPVTFSATPGLPPAIAPELGQHTEEILLELDFTWDDIVALNTSGVT